ncbi:DUF5687 family protein [Pseudozobellia thermophila]|nr:DUF5687 family protein [Pseudozobellia thermophila]
MFKKFASLQWKSFFRSSALGKSLGVKVLMGFFAVYMLVSLALLGASLFFLLQKTVPETDPLLVVNRFLLYWILAELFLRYFMQKLPVMDIRPFLILPVKKSSIAHYVLARSTVSIYNLLSLFFLVPFCTVLVMNGYPAPNVLFWFLGVVGITLSINYINFIINKSDKALIGVITVLLACYALDRFDVWPVTEYVGRLFYSLYENPFWVLLPLAVAALTYYINYAFLRNRIFLDAALRKNTRQVIAYDMEWTRRLGRIAPFLQLDLKLIWRNKRTKTQVFISLAMILYGLVFYTMEDFGPTSTMLVFVGIFMTGIFLMNFGQFIPAWDSEYYSMMMSQNIPLRTYLESKAVLIYVSIGAMFLLSIPYVYFGWEALAINFSCALYNLGVNVPIILFFGSMNKKRIDLTKSAIGNMQGAGAAQFLVGIPLFVVPLVIYFLVSFLVSFEMALILLSLIGTVGFALRKALLDKITKAYQRKKYGMVAGFKEKNS